MPTRTGETRRRVYRRGGWFLVGILAALLGLNEWVGYNLDHCSISVTSYLRVMLLMDVFAVFCLVADTYSNKIRAIRDMSQDFDESIMLQILLHSYFVCRQLFPWIMLVLIILLPRHCSSPVPGWSQAFYWTTFASSAIIGIITTHLSYSEGAISGTFMEAVKHAVDSRKKCKQLQHIVAGKDIWDPTGFYQSLIAIDRSFSGFRMLSYHELPFFEKHHTYVLDLKSTNYLRVAQHRCCVCQQPFELGEKLFLPVPCRHAYHWNCASRTLRYRNLCVVCRDSLTKYAREAMLRNDELIPLIIVVELIKRPA